MKKTPLIKIKPIKMHFGLDSDRDKVKDWRDCQPFNKRRQHMGPTEFRITENNFDEAQHILTDEASRRYGGFGTINYIAQQAVQDYYDKGQQTEMREHYSVEVKKPFNIYSFSDIGRPKNKSDVYDLKRKFKTKWYKVHPKADVLYIYDPTVDVHIYADIDVPSRTGEVIVAMTGVDKEAMKERDIRKLLNLIIENELHYI